MAKTEALLTSILLLVLLIALTVYAQSYVNAIQADTTISASTKALVRFTVTLMAVGSLVFAGSIIYIGAKKH